MFSEQMRIWGQEGKPVTQMVMLFASLGQILSPIVSEPFLAARTDQNDQEMLYNRTREIFYSSTDITTQSLVSQKIDMTLNHTSIFNRSDQYFNTEAYHSYPTTNVWYAFLITGGLSILTSSLFLPFPCNNKHQSESSPDGGRDKIHGPVKYRSVPRFVKAGLIIGISAFYMFYSILNVSCLSFLMTFLINEYDHMTKSQSAYILTLFLSCGVVSRLILIFLTVRFSAVNMLSMFVILIFTSFTLFTISANFNQTALLIVLVGMISIALSPIFPLTLSWSQTDYLQVTSRVTSFLLLVASSGAMLNPLILSYLMEEKGNMWFCYLQIIEAFIPMLIFVVMLLVNRYYVNRKYGPLKITELYQQQIEMAEKDVPSG